MKNEKQALTLNEDAAEAAAFDDVMRPLRSQTQVIDELQILRRKQPDHVPTLQRLAALYKGHDSRGLAREAYEHIREQLEEEKARAGATSLPYDTNRVHTAVHEALYDLADCHALNAGDGETDMHRATRGKAADRLLELIVLDARDPLEAHLRVGSELLRAERRSEALEWISRYEGDYPPYRYERAIDAFRSGTWAEATLALRRAMLANGYIAEHLWTGQCPPRLPWTERPGADIETASRYIGRYGGRWKSDQDAPAWVRWYWEHPETLKARSEYAALRTAWSRNQGEIRERADREMNRCIGKQTLAEAQANVGHDREKPPWRPADHSFTTH